MPPFPALRAGCLLVAATGLLQAQEAFTFRGFGTLAAARSSTDEAEYLRDVSQPKGVARRVDVGLDSRLGLQANLRLGESWEAVAQVVSSRRYDDTFRPELTWAFLKWRATEEVELRAGRLGFDVFLFADARNVGYAHLWVRPPGEYFGGIPVTSFDGGDLVWRRPMSGGFTSLKLFGGHATGRIPTFSGETFDLKDSPLLGLHLDHHQDRWGFRLAASQLRFKREFGREVVQLFDGLRDPLVATVSPTAPALADDLALTNKWVRYLSLGVEGDLGPVQAQLGLSAIQSQTPTIPRTYAGYLLLSHRAGAWTPFLNLARVKSRAERRDPGLPAAPPFDALTAGVSALLDANQNRQKSLSVGLRWDFARNLCLKGQVEFLQAEDGATLLWQRAVPTWKGRATVATLALDFVF